MTEPVETNTSISPDDDKAGKPSGTSGKHSHPESRLLELIADIKATSEQSADDPREEWVASKAARTMPEASRIASGHGYDITMVDGGHARDINTLAHDIEEFWRERVGKKDWEMAHEANRLLSQLTLVESESWH